MVFKYGKDENHARALKKNKTKTNKKTKQKNKKKNKKKKMIHGNPLYMGSEIFQPPGPMENENKSKL